MEEKITFENKITTPLQIGQQFNPYRLFVGAFIPNALMQYTGLTQGAKLVWARLAQYTGEKGEAYPKIITLAKDVGVEERQCQRYLKELENKKFIKVLRAEGFNKVLHKTNRYIFLWNEIFNVNVRSSDDIYDTSSDDIYDTLLERESVERESLKNTHKKEEDEKAVCEGEIEKIKKTKTFQNFDTAIIQNIIEKNGKETVIAAEYIEKTFSGQAQAVRNPIGLLISTLKRGTYSELPLEKANNLNSEIGKLNEDYKGFTIFRNEKIKEFLNIGGRIAFHTDNCLREIIHTPAKNAEEFKSYLQKINSS